MIRKMTINIAKVNQGRSSDVGPTQLRRKSDAAPTLLRTFLLLLVTLMAGVDEAWGQGTPVGPDYSGYYYIANYTTTKNKEKGYNVSTPALNFYLCPAQPAPDADENYNYDAIYYDGNSKQQPYLTTYKTGRVEAAMWKVEFARTISGVDYYYIRYCADNNKYLTHNTSKAAKNTRFTVHLQATAGTNNESLFCFETTDDESFNIRPQKVSSGSRHINPANGNQNYYYGINGASTTINGNEVNPGGMVGYWSDTGAAGYGSRWFLERVQPTISYNSADHKIEISNIDEDVTIYYTNDGTTAPTTGQTENTGATPIEITDVNNSVSIKAIAAKSGVLPSPVSEIRVVPNATITFGSSSTYNASEQKPAVIVKDGGTTIQSKEYEVSYSNNVNASDAAVATITNKEGGNYIVYGSTTFTISPRPLTITAVAKSKTYGEVDPALTYTSSGLVGSDVVTGSLIREVGENAGTYQINHITLTAGPNYTITYVPANFTINKKGLTITAEAKSKTYGDADPALTYTSDGLINSDAITGALTRPEGENAGSYAISQGTLTAGNNYSITYTPANLTINPKGLTVTAVAKSKVYGDADPALTYTSVGLINSDAFTGALSRVAGENAGTYTINKGSLTAGNNYSMTYTPANLTITKASLNIAAEAKAKEYSDADPEWTYTAEGFKGSDTESIMTGSLTRDAGENVGTYSITQGTLASSANYDVVYSPATFTISPKSLGDGTTPASGITIELTKTGDNFTTIVKNGNTTLEEGTDYDIIGPTDDDGYRVLTITGKEHYQGEIQAIFQTLAFWATGETTEGMKNATPYMTEKANLTQPADMTPYIVSGINMTKHVLHLKRLSYIPKDVPVLLLADELANPQTTEFMTSAKNVEDEEDTSHNQLKRSEGQHVETGQVYAFYKGKFVLTSSGTLTAGKFYLDNPNYYAITEGGSGGDSNAAPLRIVLEDATGIDVTLNDEQIGTHDIWHSVDGRRMNGKPASKGVYINNGRKVVVK